MKKIIYTILTTALLASCADFLDIRTEATMPTSGTDYSKSELIFQSVSAAYATLRLSTAAREQLYLDWDTVVDNVYGKYQELIASKKKQIEQNNLGNRLKQAFLPDVDA
ncbi:MAG: hypothetical protein IJS70_10115 [Bacteroidales bacterium]|nr:hypothetical protein [Bacteroidales bacterium]